MAFEVIAVDSWIASTLSGDATLAAAVRAAREAAGADPVDLDQPFVWLDNAPETVPNPDDPSDPRAPVYPFVVFNLQASTDRIAMGGERYMTLPIVYARVHGEGQDIAALAPIAHRMDDLLHHPEPAAVSFGGLDFSILGSVRKSTIQRPADREGEIFSTLGGLYQFITQ